MHTLENFHAFDFTAEIILTLPLDWQNYWKELVIKRGCSVPHAVVDGGTERYHSVKHALAICNRNYVAVHDGVRPLVSHETLDRCIQNVLLYKAVVPVLPVKESLRKVEENDSVAVNRSEYRLVQTPQCFDISVLRKAYEQDFHPGITDDASLIEEMGVKVHLVEGNEENIKITTQTDLLIAEALLKTKKRSDEI